VTIAISSSVGCLSFGCDLDCLHVTIKGML
jgi:hypothetical protein